MTRSRFPRILLLLAIPIALFMLPTLSGLLTDWWWFQEVGHEVVFTKTLVTKVALFFAAGLIAALVFGGNLAFAQRGALPEPVLVKIGDATQSVDLTSVLRRFTRPITIVLSLMIALGAMSMWDTVLLFFNRTAFGTADPVFSRDIGWYVFSLPALSALIGVLRSLVTLSLFLLIPLYFFRGDVVLLPQRLRIEPTAGRHLGVLLAVWFVLGAASLWFVDSSNLLYSTTGPLVGASYADLNASLPAIRLSRNRGADRRSAGRWSVHSADNLAGMHFSVSQATRWLACWGAEWCRRSCRSLSSRRPSSRARHPYLAHHIDATRRAWGLDSVEVAISPAKRV